MEPKPTPAAPAPDANSGDSHANNTSVAPQTPGNFEAVVISPTVTSPTPDATPESVPVATATSPIATTPSATNNMRTINPVAATEETAAPPTVESPAPVSETTSPSAPPAPTDIPPLAAVPTPPTQPASVMGGGFSPTDPSPKSKSRKKLFVIIGSSVAAFLLLSGGFVFGYYLPNTPSRVWDTGLNRTGNAFEKVVTSATEEKKLESYKTSEISGSIDATVGEASYKGTFASTFDELDSDNKVTISTKDEAGKSTELAVQALTNIPEGSNFPDIYFKVAGLKSLGLDAFVPELSTYDNKWIVVDSKYLESIGNEYLSGTDNNQQSITSADIAELARSTATVTSEYLMTTDKDKAVLTQQSFVGKETVDGVHTYHYKAGIDIAHAKAYCKALSNALLSSNAYKKVAQPKDDELAQAKTDVAKECDMMVDETFKANDTFDLWVDAKYKLIYKIRIYDKENKGIYTDVGQLYKGDDKLSLFVAVHDEDAKADAKFVLETDLKTSTTTGNLTAKSTSEDMPFDVTVKLTAKLSQEDVKFTKPSPTIPIEQLLNALGFDSAVTGSTGSTTSPATGSVQSKAQDTERKTDINAIESHANAYYAQNGFYPTLANINSVSWRTINMKGLDPEALKDPNGTSATLGAVAGATQYGYVAMDCEAEGCQGITLTAKLSDGTVYKKVSN